MYDKETLLASVDCIELARYLGMPIEKHGSSYFTMDVIASAVEKDMMRLEWLWHIMRMY